MKSRKVAVTAASGLLLVLLYGLIFSFSAQDGEASTNISLGVSGFGVRILDRLTGGIFAAETLKKWVLLIEHPIRKMAHFLEYALMGILVFGFLYYPITKPRLRNWFTLVWVFLSALADEIHQYFVPGRWCSMWDVLLDTCGGIAGILICILSVFWYKKRLKKRP